MKALILVALILVGCGPTEMFSDELLAIKLKPEIMDGFRAKNRSSLNSLEIGMSKARVHEVMGRFDSTNTSRWNKTVELVNPYRTSAFKRDTLQIEILWYNTDQKSDDGAVTDDELTPVILFNDKVIGWGREFWFDTAEKYEIRIR